MSLAQSAQKNSYNSIVCYFFCDRVFKEHEKGPVVTMLKVQPQPYGCGFHLITERSLCAGDVIAVIHDAVQTPHPTYQTIQIGSQMHLCDLGVVAYMNHSCEPSALIDVSSMTVVATRHLSPGEEINFFYPSTEWEMAQPFVCTCGSPRCVRLVAGAKFLSVDALSRYFINAHVQEMVQQSLVRTSSLKPFLVSSMPAQSWGSVSPLGETRDIIQP